MTGQFHREICAGAWTTTSTDNLLCGKSLNGPTTTLQRSASRLRMETARQALLAVGYQQQEELLRDNKEGSWGTLGATDQWDAANSISWRHTLTQGSECGPGFAYPAQSTVSERFSAPSMVKISLTLVSPTTHLTAQSLVSTSEPHTNQTSAQVAANTMVCSTWRNNPLHNGLCIYSTRVSTITSLPVWIFPRGVFSLVHGNIFLISWAIFIINPL